MSRFIPCGSKPHKVSKNYPTISIIPAKTKKTTHVMHLSPRDPNDAPNSPDMQTITLA